MQRIIVGTVIIILASITFYRIFVNILQPPVERWDEQTNIEVVTDSISHNALPLLFIDNKPFFEKPPLWYLTAAGVVKMINHPILSLRLVTAVSGAGVILLTVFLAWRWWGAYAAISTWITLLLTNQLFITNAGGYFSSHTFRSADVDALQILFITITFALCTRITANNLMAVSCGITTGLAFLTKGPLGMFPLLVAALLMVPLNKIAKQSFFIAWIIFFLTSVPWYLFMIISFGLPFISAHFGYHIIDRTLSPIEGHYGPVWYYLSLIGNHSVFFSWELFVCSLVWIQGKKLYKDVRVRYTLILMAVFIIVPTIVSTRLAWYILPFYPFAALVIGIAVADVVKSIMKHL